MLSAAVAVVACLSLARSSPADPHTLRAYPIAAYTTRDLTNILANIDERLRMLDTITAVQAKQARRLDVIQDKLDRMETTISLRLERAQLAADKLEHRLHMLQTSVQAAIKQSSEKIERSQNRIVEIAQNLTEHIDTHKVFLEQVSASYHDTWRRSMILESLMRDGMALVNVTRRELADGLRALARRQRDARLNSADLEAAFTRRLNDNTIKLDFKMQEVLNAQKRFVDSCQRVQLDDPTHVADVLEKLIDSLINKTASTFHELQNIQNTIRNHDTKVMKILNSRPAQAEASCKRLESVIRNSTSSAINEKELQQLTEKFIGLTNRADAALQKLESKISESNEDLPAPDPDVSSETDKLFQKLQWLKNEADPEDNDDWDDDEKDESYFDETVDGFTDEDQEIFSEESAAPKPVTTTEGPVTRPPHRRHLHKHPYDRGPIRKKNDA